MQIIYCVTNSNISYLEKYIVEMFNRLLIYRGYYRLTYYGVSLDM